MLKRTDRGDSTSRPYRHTGLFWASLCLLLLAAALGISRLDDDALWMDEYLSIYDIGGMDDSGLLSPAGVWERIATRNPYHAPGFFILLNGWARVVGTEPALLRFFSLLVGMLALAITYRIGRDFISPQVGVYVLVVMSVSTFYQHFLHELRMYSLMALFTALSLWCYLTLVNRMYRVRWWVWVGFAVGMGGLMYSHYFSALMAATIGLYHLLFAPKRKQWWWALALMAGVLLLFVPWVASLLAGLQETFDDTQLREKALTLGESMTGLTNALSNGSLFLLVSVAVLMVFALVCRERGTLQIAFFALVSVSLLLLANEIVGMMHGRRLRYFMVMWVPLSLLLAVGIDAAKHLPMRGASTVLAALWLLWGVGQVVTGQHQVRHDGANDILLTHQIARELAPYAQADDFLYVFPPDNESSWRYHFVSDFYLTDTPYYFMNVNPDNSPPDDPAEVYADMGDRARVWLAHMPDESPAAYTPFTALISDSHNSCLMVNDNGVELVLYSSEPICCVMPENALAQFTPDVRLMQQHLEQTDNTLSVTLGWAHTDAIDPNLYSVGLFIHDAEGQRVTQVDYGLPTYDYDCYTADIPLETLSVGTYTLETVVYNWQTGERLPTGTTPDATFTAAQFTVRSPN